jgi:hypothetical protein
MYGATNIWSDPSMAKEILSGGNIGRAPKDFKAADYMTERAAAEGPSAKINRTFKALKKQGWRLKKQAPDTFAPVAPGERIEAAKAKGIGFVMRDGKLVPVRNKK